MGTRKKSGKRTQRIFWMWILLEGIAYVMSKDIRTLKQGVFSWLWVFQQQCVVEMNGENEKLSGVTFSLTCAAGS